MIAQRDALLAEKEVIIAKNMVLLEERDGVISSLEGVIATSAGSQEFEDLKAHVSLVEAEKELEHRKARHFWLQVTTVTAAKQVLQLKIDSSVEYARGLQGLLDTSRSSIEAVLTQERATADQAIKVQKADAFRSGFEEGSRLPAERSIKSPKEYEEQIGFFEVVDRFVSTPADLQFSDPTLVASPSFNTDSFFVTSDPSQ